MRSPAPARLRSWSAPLSSKRSSACRSVLLVADMGAPRGAVALIVDFDHREVGHEAIRRGTVPVVLVGFEEHAVARADDLDRRAATLRATDAIGDVDGLPVRMRVPRRSRARREMDAARAQARGS